MAGAGPIPDYGMSELPTPKNFAETAALKPGTVFLDPTGTKRVRPELLKVQKDQYADLPEGASFVAADDPEQVERIKPAYQGVGFTAQFLHDSALTPEGKKSALERSYPGKVKEGPDGLYVDDGGTYRKPGRGASGALGSAAANTAPALGMVGGGALGGVGGTVMEPGGGTAAGAFGGAVLGAMAGRQFNNVMLSLAGIHEGLGEQVSSDLWEGAAVASGDAGGQVIARIPGAASATKRAISDVGSKVGNIREKLPDVLEAFGITPQRARSFLGTDETRAQSARDVTQAAQDLGINRGIVAPSVLAPELPFLHKVEDWDQIFRKQNVFAVGRRSIMSARARNCLRCPRSVSAWIRC